MTITTSGMGLYPGSSEREYVERYVTSPGLPEHVSDEPLDGSHEPLQIDVGSPIASREERTR